MTARIIVGLTAHKAAGKGTAAEALVELGFRKRTFSEPIRALAVSIGKAMTGDFAGAAAEIKGIGSTIAGAWDTAFNKISESSQKTSDRIGRVWAWTKGPDAAKGDSGAATGDKTAPDLKAEDEAARKAEQERKKREREAAKA